MAIIFIASNFEGVFASGTFFFVLLDKVPVTVLTSNSSIPNTAIAISFTNNGAVIRDLPAIAS